MAKTKRIPTRDRVKTGDTWDLTKLFKSDAAWERGCKKFEKMVPEFAKFRGTLGRSANRLQACFEFEIACSKLGERLGAYASLKYSEDVSNTTYQGMIARFTYFATQMEEASSFIAPEIQAIPKTKMAEFMKHKALAPYRFSLEKLLRYRPHVLSENEERLLAMQGEVAGSTSKIFSQLNDADMTFGTVTDEDGNDVELSQSSFRALLESRKRSVRKTAFHQYYGRYEEHKNTLAAVLSGSVLQDVYNARVRNYPSAREAALFSDNVPVTVYDSLIDTVHDNLNTEHRYLDARKKALKLKDLHAYDNYVPMVKRAPVDIPYEEAVDTICAALEPLGNAYVKTMREGLLERRWVDRYENKNKRSGAFSYGAYDSPPYILMNYKSNVLDSMFTLAHEAGHSMHTHFSQKHQPYQYSHYTIFVAEVASTFNEQLLNHYLLGRATNKTERAYLISKGIDEIRGTIVRQTMFAEFEKLIHEQAEQGMPLTIDVFRGIYRELVERYFGKKFTIDDELELEGLRIPHFYSAFYVYKYATGLSAAIMLSRMVLNGGAKERDRYLHFLSSGGSKFPLDLLRDAGVDLRTPEPVENAMAHYRDLVKELSSLV